MHCDFVKLENGQRIIICGARRPKEKVRRCHNCGARATLLCDATVQRNGRKATCDLPMCSVCSVPMGENVDYCRSHHALSQRQGQLFV